MPVDVRWGDPEKTILHYVMQDPWMWDDFYTATTQGQALREAEEGGKDRRARLILDFTQARSLPADALTHFGNQLRRRPAGTDAITRIVIVAASPFMRALSDIIARLFPKVAHKLHHVSTLEEAFRYLASLPEKHTPEA